MTLHYSDPELAALGVTEADLKILYWDGATWVDIMPCAGCNINAETNQVILRLDHFTEFALVGEQQRLYLPLVIR